MLERMDKAHGHTSQRSKLVLMEPQLKPSVPDSLA
jgi:hypothetical protein